MGMGVSGSAGGGRRRRRGGRSAAMSEINITPMVDVMLVLLIIFMVAAPMLTVGVPVKLPETAAAALPTEQEEPLTVTITADGRLAIQATEVSDAEMIGKLQAIAAERTSKKIYLRADGSVAYERVAQVMGALNAGGFNEIAFVTDAATPSLGAGDASNSGNDGG
jgi:biopolymer transport protein TolR